MRRTYKCKFCRKAYHKRSEADKCSQLFAPNPSYFVNQSVLGVKIIKVRYILHVSGKSGKRRHVVVYEFETPLIVGEKVFHKLSEPGLLALIARIEQNWPQAL